MVSFEWAAIEAIGTVGAVVVALALAIAPAWNTRRKRPRLTLHVSRVEPHCVSIAGSDSMVEWVMLRVEVRNEGKRGASHMTAKVTGHWIEDLPVMQDDYPPGLLPHRSDGWRLRETEPVALRWASGRDVAIAPGQSEFACLVTLRPRDSDLTLCMLDPENSIVKPGIGRGLARHRLRVVVSGDECEPAVEVVEFVIDGKHFVSDVSIAEVPDKAEDTRLLTLLRQMAESPDELTPETTDPPIPGGLRPLPHGVETARQPED